MDNDKLAASAGEMVLVGSEEIQGRMEIRSINGGFQHLYRFPNGRGASVVCHEFSYGGREGLLELAVLRLTGEDFVLDYSTPITSDVLGWLSEDEANETVLRIAALPPPVTGEDGELPTEEDQPLADHEPSLLDVLRSLSQVRDPD